MPKRSVAPQTLKTERLIRKLDACRCSLFLDCRHKHGLSWLWGTGYIEPLANIALRSNQSYELLRGFLNQEHYLTSAKSRELELIRK